MDSSGYLLDLLVKNKLDFEIMAVGVHFPRPARQQTSH